MNRYWHMDRYGCIWTDTNIWTDTYIFTDTNRYWWILTIWIDMNIFTHMHTYARIWADIYRYRKMLTYSRVNILFKYLFVSTRRYSPWISDQKIWTRNQRVNMSISIYICIYPLIYVHISAYVWICAYLFILSIFVNICWYLSLTVNM